jgi:hypothetical protein
MSWGPHQTDGVLALRWCPVGVCTPRQLDGALAQEYRSRIVCGFGGIRCEAEVSTHANPDIAVVNRDVVWQIGVYFIMACAGRRKGGEQDPGAVAGVLRQLDQRRQLSGPRACKRSVAHVPLHHCLIYNFGVLKF